MTPLPVNLTPTTKRTAYGGLASWLNNLNTHRNLFDNGLVGIGAGIPNSSLVPVDPTMLVLKDSSEVAPQTVYKPTFLVSRVEKILTTTHANDPMYSAAIAGHIQSLLGNKNQPVGVLGRSYGASEGGAYNVGLWGDAVNNAGVAGGAMGAFLAPLSQVEGNNAWGQQTAIQVWHDGDTLYTPTYSPAGIDMGMNILSNAGVPRSGVYGAGLWIRSLALNDVYAGGWDVGIGFADSYSSLGAYLGPGIVTADIISDSHAGYGYRDRGTHNVGIDQSAAAIASWTAYLKGTNGQVGIDNRNAGEQASITFHDAATAKWVIGKQTDNSFIVFNAATSTIDISITPAAAVNIAASGKSLGFYGHTPTALQTGVPVTAAGIHAALVALGLITA